MPAQQQGFPRLNTPFVDLGRDGIISIPWYRFLITLWNRTGGSNASGVIAPGLMQPFGGQAANIPDGWLLCDGTAVSRSTFDLLFGAIGTTWGSGDGSTTFNLPNLNGKFFVAAGGGYLPGATGGADSYNLTVGQLPSHSHTVVDPGHAHTQQVVSNNTAGTAGSQGASAANTTSVGTTDSHTTGITIGNTGSGDAIDNRPAYAAALMLIKF